MAIAARNCFTKMWCCAHIAPVCMCMGIVFMVFCIEKIKGTKDKDEHPCACVHRNMFHNHSIFQVPPSLLFSLMII